MPDGISLKSFSGTHPAQFVNPFFEHEISTLLESGQLKPNRPQVVQGGLDAVGQALELSAAGASCILAVSWNYLFSSIPTGKVSAGSMWR